MNLVDSLGRRSVPRKSHRKSRGGCRSCKQKRIKCDEARPACTQCSTRRTSCEYAFSSPGQTDLDSTYSTVKVDGFTTHDFGLFHHYITKTVHCFEIETAEPEDCTGFWQHILPKLTFDNPFLLRLVLALTAQHKASLSPADDAETWRVEAGRQYAAALPVIIDGIPNMNASTSGNLYIGSILICFYHFSRGPVPGEYLAFSNKGQAEPEWMSLFRGVKALNTAPVYRDTSASGLATRPIATSRRTAPNATASAGDTAYRELLSSFRQLLATLTDENKDHTYVIEALNGLIPILDAQFDLNFEPTKETQHAHICFSWLYSVPDEYIAMLQDRNSPALVVFAYFAARLKEMEREQPWPFTGWSRHVMNGVEENIDTAWEHWLQWPRYRFNSQL